MQTDEGRLVGYFGFGSLVNQDTLRTRYHSLIPCSLKGWRRHWQARTDTIEQNVALLSIHTDPDCTIHGMLVLDWLSNLPAVDEREAGYSRFSLKPADLSLAEDAVLPDELYVYVADEADQRSDEGALLQSYLDAVLQGYHRVYGSAGVEHFVETTAKFDRPIVADRSAPLYPRSVEVSDGEAELFDRMLVRAGVLF